MWLTARDLAKFGLLYLNRGTWKGEAIVPPEWVSKSMLKNIPAQAHDSALLDGYGYNFWLGEIEGHRFAMAWGYGGQVIYIIEDLKMVVVMTTTTACGSAMAEDEVVGKFEAVMRNYVIPAAVRGC